MKREFAIFLAVAAIVLWFTFSLLGSGFSASLGDCGVSRPIKYVLYTGWFCPLNDAKKGNP